MVMNNRFIESYSAIYKKIYEKYHPTVPQLKPSLINHVNPKVNIEDPIFRAIMDDDLKTFILLTEMESFDKNKTLSSGIYPYNNKRYTLLEICSYQGAANCFKFLRTEYESKITDICLGLSFLGGNADIISECLKYQKPNDICMKYAIASHNIDFVTFLMNEHQLGIKIDSCCHYNNL
ncbi:hypothetical protein TVAG_271170 [Trichomonas vaginalis G3]|uniref:DUF3447 domain-containing protein n=1 Tax=Trichomonas vaginalis (strain ATCC PRA-98 / G3) TaxID=412133 RepID=A2EA86_TRIV3|nr:spectrin binding [Trichomonas vaginalis G3]EAY10426.1 hypothetical protein TVAG_271170 [Trichomonas vaginalis G3]KAI5548332.1 spectrin binding [Trichomonas vaginalis G3]|eukprot:XP_001322649.1 hypothetical protein [Trichomonas vaginalis G3]